jgi:succinate dehydrogenase / fumarate reductase cytochrome b subunit
LTTESAGRERLVDRHYFLLRRLHSLSGVFPIGIFLIPHLTTNSSIVWGRYLNSSEIPEVELERAGVTIDVGVETFQHEVNFIHSLPFLVLIELTVLWLPIAFHALLGLYYATTGKGNVRHYRYQDNWRYTLQRVTGYIGIVYIFLHVSSLRWGWTYFGLLPEFDVHHAASTTAEHLQASPLGLLLPLFYLLAVIALVYHFANGLWTAAITWGLTVSTRAQQRWGYICTAVGIALAVMGVMSVYGFWSLDVNQAERIEMLMSGEVPPIEITGLMEPSVPQEGTP